ncbi:TniQ family protein [Streptomyces sp. NBC_01275]|uniref:TniQ family protein n=1 Tax=Streptomyces sp. NBC_01275 TaxID=2903807 RepID=UPI002250F112|nr:TniQ family protein [Streptomyces sp. NBC_01275]MCX4759607.1 TniQ family protein [Streptomyces sp. NBC_01275]
MAWSNERIPLWVPPVEGEALDSWLAAYSRRLRTDLPHFVRFLGLPQGRGNLMVRCLTEHEQEVLSKRTGLGSDCLTAMTLQPWDDLAVIIDRPTRRLIRPPHWRHTGNYTRYCPRCLDETAGRWQIAWRLPWSFACTRHGTMLLDRCPECGQPPLVHGRRQLRNTPSGVCLYGTGSAHAVRCGFFLPYAATPLLPPGSLVMKAQEEVNSEVLRIGVPREAAAQRGRELAALAHSALLSLRSTLDSAPAVVHAVLAECGGLPEAQCHHGGSDSHNAAIGTAIASIALNRERDDSDAVFSWLMGTDRLRRHRAHPTPWLANWVPAGPEVTSRALAVVAGELTWIARLRYGAATATPAWPTLTDEDVQRRASRLPAMLWPAWTIRILPRLPEPVFRLAGLRRACATLLLMPGTFWNYPQAAALLGNPRAYGNREALDTSLDKQRPDELDAVLVLLARALDTHPVPIDYHRRRTTFSEASVSFDLNALREYCRRRGLRNGPVHTKRLRWRLLRLLLGADPGTSSRTPAWNADLSQQFSGEFRDFLLQQATANLKAHGIDEPVLWQPPPAWLDDVAYPGIDPDTINTAKLSALLVPGHPLAQIADTMGISEDHILLHIESIGSSAPLPSASRLPAQGRNIPRQGLLASEELRRLYLEQGLSFTKLAQMAGCSDTTVRRALAEVNIASRRTRGCPPLLPARVSREWLDTEYSLKGRSVPDIAREVGVHKDSVSDQLQRWGIPRRPEGPYSNPFASLNVTLSPTMQRLSRTRNCLTRLRNLLHIPGHPHVTAAAKSLGICPTTLRKQLRDIESALGTTVIARTNPLSIARTGAAFLREARHLIALLDNEARPKSIMPG